ncbi:uncharacterized protein LOC115447569 isoform X3 [Manduca sexta]|uniref:uncharacterized protein LOC115447569 isoform X3 n=1 Tax=Manduca sexta TaxID=7130 RepID=UPI0018908090|nr:uncharacterized protein LOC115447569 isoform X3 [Manduca sexta]
MKTFVILFALMAMAAAQGSVNFVDEADNSQQDSGRRGYRPQPAENRLTVTNNGCGVYVVESTHNQGNTITVHPHDGQGSGSVIQIGSSQGCGNVMFVDNNNPGGGVIVNPDPFFGQPSGPAAIDISPAFVDPRPNYPYPYRPTNNGARSG